MPWRRLTLFAFLALMIVGCGTMPLKGSSGLDNLARALACPAAPVRLTESLPLPLFQSEESWVEWSDKLLDFAAEEHKRRQELVAWQKENCK